jgi:hypothetical protein
MSLWRRLPPEQYDNLLVLTAAGTEVLIQTVLRIEADFVAVRGRLAASSETGRVYFIPYSQIDCMGFQKSLREEEFATMFPEVEAPKEAIETAPAPSGPTTPLPPSKPLAGSSTHGGAHSDRARNGNRSLPLKSELLERLRSRSHQGSTPRPPLEE